MGFGALALDPMFHVKHHHKKESYVPKVEVEILRTVTVTRSESAIVELGVPKSVLDNADVTSWVDEVMGKSDDGTMTIKEKAVYEAVDGAEWYVNDEDESIEYDEAYAVD